MKKLLHIDLDDSFKAELGLVMTGNIDVKYHGQIKIGNYIEFNLEDITLTRKILGVDYFRPSHYIDYDKIKTRTAALLVECNSEEELHQILGTKLIGQIGTIYKNIK